MTRSVRLGTFTGQGTGNDTVSLVCEHPDLRRHLHKPWCLSYLSQNYKAQYGDILQATTIEANAPNTAPNPVCTITEDTFARHAVLCGASGSGKTRLMVHLLSGQLPWGCSLIAIDPKKKRCSGFFMRHGRPASPNRRSAYFCPLLMVMPAPAGTRYTLPPV